MARDLHDSGKSPLLRARLRAHGIAILTMLLAVGVPAYAMGHGHAERESVSIGSATDATQSPGSCPMCRIAHDRAIDVPTKFEQAEREVFGHVAAHASPPRASDSSLRLPSRAPPTLF